MTDNWKAALGFSKRLELIQSITTSYRHISPSSSFAEAQQNAVRYENEAFTTATSKIEYDRLCQDAIDKIEGQNSGAPVVQSPDIQYDKEDEQSLKTATKIGHYERCVHLFDGLMSTIYRSKSADGTLVALKVTTPHLMGAPHDSRREVRILREAAHEHVIRLLESFELAGGQLILVLPYMQYNLGELLRQDMLTPSQVKAHLRDLFHGLAHIHALGVIHRDVKPSNILLNEPGGPAYLADFGISWKETDPGSEPATQKIIDVGTTSYRPPEILFGSKDYGTSLDMWAAGCVVAEAVDVRHRQLFDSGDLGSELALIKSIFTTLGTPNTAVWPESARLPDWGKFEFYEYPAKPWEEILNGTSSQARDLVSKLICYESSSRLNAEQALRHPFLSVEPMPESVA